MGNSALDLVCFDVTEGIFCNTTTDVLVNVAGTEGV